jgi:hypothetical protein
MEGRGLREGQRFVRKQNLANDRDGAPDKATTQNDNGKYSRFGKERVSVFGAGGERV